MATASLVVTENHNFRQIVHNLPQPRYHVWMECKTIPLRLHSTQYTLLFAGLFETWPLIGPMRTILNGPLWCGELTLTVFVVRVRSPGALILKQSWRVPTMCHDRSRKNFYDCTACVHVQTSAENGFGSVENVETLVLLSSIVQSYPCMTRGYESLCLCYGSSVIDSGLTWCGRIPNKKNWISNASSLAFETADIRYQRNATQNRYMSAYARIMELWTCSTCFGFLQHILSRPSSRFNTLKKYALKMIYSASRHQEGLLEGLLKNFNGPTLLAINQPPL